MSEYVILDEKVDPLLVACRVICGTIREAFCVLEGISHAYLSKWRYLLIDFGHVEGHTKSTL
jgi:hypothetical protein